MSLILQTYLTIPALSLTLSTNATYRCLVGRSADLIKKNCKENEYLDNNEGSV